MSKKPVYYRTYDRLEITVHKEPVSLGGDEFSVRLLKRNDAIKSNSRFLLSDLTGLQLLIRDVQLTFLPLDLPSDAELDKFCL